MKYYSEKLNKLFDTEKELIDAENLPKRLGYWKITLTHYIEELSKADQKLDEELAYCIKEIGEESCDKILLTAHRHHFSADESNECLVVSNGSLMGTDSYAANLRLSSKPTQNLIIVSEDNVAQSIYRIIVEE